MKPQSPAPSNTQEKRRVAVVHMEPNGTEKVHFSGTELRSSPYSWAFVLVFSTFFDVVFRPNMQRTTMHACLN